MEIRKVRAKDLDKIAYFEKEFFHEDAFSLETLENTIKDEHFMGFVVEEGTEVIGYVFVTYFGDEANLLKIAIDKFYRKKGIAKSLLLKCIEEFKELYITNFFLEVDENNNPARKLYESLGFEKTRIRNNYYKNGDNAIEMVKHIWK